MPLSPLDSPGVCGAGHSWLPFALTSARAVSRAAPATVVLAALTGPSNAQFAISPPQVGPSLQSVSPEGPALNAQSQLLAPLPLMVTGYDETPAMEAPTPPSHAQGPHFGPPPLIVTGYEVSPVVLPEHANLDDALQPTVIDEPPLADAHRPPVSARIDAWHWHLPPDGLIYRSYLAGFKEPRMHSFWAYEDELGWVWDIALGGRVGLLRYGTCDNVLPDGWQIDLEGAAFPRLDPEEEERDLVAGDFRAGVPLTYGNGPSRTKLAYYHLSSHLGDEFLLKNPTVMRYNYSRDVLVLGQALYLNPDWRIYAEAGWAYLSDVSGEWEFQFGVDYSPLVDTGRRGAPFMAVNGHLREEVDFGGNLVFQLGWQWRQGASGHLLRLGLQYYNGKSDQFEFFDRYENKVGLAIWYDY